MRESPQHRSPDRLLCPPTHRSDALFLLNVTQNTTAMDRISMASMMRNATARRIICSVHDVSKFSHFTLLGSPIRCTLSACTPRNRRGFGMNHRRLKQSGSNNSKW